jgi:K+-transporting ATPase c subunit
LRGAEFQLDRVAGKWAQDLKHDPAQVRQEIEVLLQTHPTSPGDGAFGEPFINVLDLILTLRHRHGAPS